MVPCHLVDRAVLSGFIAWPSYVMGHCTETIQRLIISYANLIIYGHNFMKKLFLKATVRNLYISEAMDLSRHVQDKLIQIDLRSVQASLANKVEQVI